jgi:hypothetical protein
MNVLTKNVSTFLYVQHKERINGVVSLVMKIKDENFYTVLGWMLNVLELHGNELIVFAIIYSFSQDGESEFKGSINYLKSFANIKSRQTVVSTLDTLVEKKYITKRPFLDGNLPRVAYRVDMAFIEQIKKGMTSLVPRNNADEN